VDMKPARATSAKQKYETGQRILQRIATTGGGGFIKAGRTCGAHKTTKRPIVSIDRIPKNNARREIKKSATRKKKTKKKAMKE